MIYLDHYAQKIAINAENPLLKLRNFRAEILEFILDVIFGNKDVNSMLTFKEFNEKFDKERFVNKCFKIY